MPPPGQARQLVNALASGSSVTMKTASKLVAGPVMTRYVSLQVIEDEANEQAGQAAGPERSRRPATAPDLLPGRQRLPVLHRLPGRLRRPDHRHGRRWPAVAARLAAGPSDSGGGIAITDVASYLSTSTGT